MVEHPQDPQEYVDDGKEYPSFWEWEETAEFLQRHRDMFQIRVDQAGLKHQRPKPTTLSNMGQLKELDGITSNGSGKEIQSDLTKGTDLGVSKRRKVEYALIATIPVPQWPTPGETEISPEDPKVDPAADSKEAPKGGDEVHPGEEQPEAVVPSRGRRGSG